MNIDLAAIAARATDAHEHEDYPLAWEICGTDVPALLSELKRLTEALAGYGKMDADLAIAERRLAEINSIVAAMKATPYIQIRKMLEQFDRIAQLSEQKP